MQCAQFPDDVILEMETVAQRPWAAVVSEPDTAKALVPRLGQLLVVKTEAAILLFDQKTQ